MAKDQIETTIQKSTQDLLTAVQISGSATVSLDAEKTYHVDIQTEEPSLLIGYHGETLSSFQLILGLILCKEAGEWVRVVVEVGDYRARRQEQLQAMAASYANQAVSTQQTIYLPYLHPAERRIIHLVLQDDSRVECFSEGEGRNRRIIIKPK